MRKIFAFQLLLTASFFIYTNTFAQMEFVENKGQWHPNVNYRGDFKTGTFFLENSGFSVLMHDPKDIDELSGIAHGHSITKDHPAQPVTVHSFNYQVKFSGASPNIKSIPGTASASYNNYFIGNDKSKWAGGCKIYQAITYKNVYPDIDVRYYSEGGSLKYDFIVYPGGNVSAIAMRYDGPTDVLVKDKELIIKTPVGDVRELYPFSYQSDVDQRREVSCRYVVKNNLVTFDVGKDYDPSKTLVIDPSIIFASFTGSTIDNWGYTATFGPDGSLFAGGIVFGSGYLTSPGASQETYAGGITEDGFSGYDIGIFKFSPDGRLRTYATYLGGSGNEQPHSMIVDAQGNLIVAGRSNSNDYPRRTLNVGPHGLFDIVITKFNAAGTDIIGSVKIGGSGDDGVNIRPKYRGIAGVDGLRRNYGDDARSEVILDASNNIILVSSTQPGPNMPANFPVTASNGIQSSFGGGRQDGVILKFNSDLSAYLFGSYFGGSGDDACFVTSISPVTGDLYIGGATTSTNLPGDHSNVRTSFGSNQGGPTDGFITRVKLDGSGIVKTIYVGTSGADMLYGLKFDRSGFPYCMGTTNSGTWPIIAASFSNPGSGQFICKLKADLSDFVYSTVFGSGSSVPNISPIAFLVDRCDNVYVSGWGGGINVSQGYSTGNTFGLPEVNALHPPGFPAPDGQDFYFFVLEKNAQSQLFGTHFGQNGGLGDHVDGGTSRFDENGVIYQAVCANCGSAGDPNVIFPTTPGVWRRENGSSACNEAALKIEMNFAGVAAGLQTTIDNVVSDTSGCVDLTVVFRDTLQKGKTYYWDFGDNSLPNPVITTSFDVTHTYYLPGRYRVRLIAEDLNTCNQRDTAYVTIRAGDNRATLDFNAVKLPPCTSLTYKFTNTSTAVNTSLFGPQTFIWDFGDGSALVTAPLSPPIEHTFPAEGNYQVVLTLQDTNFCNSPVSRPLNLRINSLVDARFETSPVGCAPYQAVFNNTSTAGTDWIWDFGDHTSSTEESPVHAYQSPGIYQVNLIAIDTNTCNKRDTSAYFTITVSAKPTAKFSWAPDPPQQNTATRFTNLSSGASRYLWLFGEEGETSTETNPEHQYNSTGNFTATLIAYNEAGCSDTFSLRINALILPLLDVPNAFTPGQFGINGFVSVKGYGIGKMDWKIYNRWGQMVYHTTSRKDSWDGTFKGKGQPLDVYTYTLDVEFTDGKKYRKTGDITLLR